MPALPFVISPSPKFALPRSYITQLVIGTHGYDCTKTGNVFTCNSTYTPGQVEGYEIAPYVWPWSSNKYTLDYIVIDSWWTNTAEPWHHPNYYSLTYQWRGDPGKPVLYIFNPFLHPNDFVFDLPDAPSGYWLPPWAG